MNSWDAIVMEYMKTGETLPCPICKSSFVTIEKHVGKIRDSLSLKCSVCNASTHYDGIIKR